ncbi:MAG: FecR domain-containing protein [Tannerellaceae bacterium]|jgi:YD repeat-containing protein|nr:FecR domain-containing protein [Tannerellaceae bacterium]
MEIDRNILVRYFLGQCLENEKEEIRQWLESNEANRQQFIRERIRFDASIVIDERKISSIHRQRRAESLVRKALKVASAILVLVGSSYLFTLYQTKKADNAVLQQVYVPAGNRTSVTLPDGSLVWLNSNTTLTYPNVFSGKERSVELDGEAYFEIVKSDKKSFIVKTGEYHIEVLGTTFNVEAYAGKPYFKTALFTGKVKLYKEQRKEEPLYLKTGETAESAGGTLVVSSTASNSYRWRDGLIMIEDNSFEEIMLLFEKYFGQHIIIQNEKVKDLGYRGKLRIADGIDHALRVLQNDFRFTYKREEDTNTIFIY